MKELEELLCPAGLCAGVGREAPLPRVDFCAVQRAGKKCCTFLKVFTETGTHGRINASETIPTRNLSNFSFLENCLTACLHVQLLGGYLVVCLAQSQGSKGIITFQGRIRLCIFPLCYSHLVSASGNSLFLPAMSPTAPGQHRSRSVGFPAWPEAPSRGTTRFPPPLSGVSMLLDPFHSVECHLLASPLISPRRRIARLRGAGHMLRFLNQLQLSVEARAAGEAPTALLCPRTAVPPGQSSAAQTLSFDPARSRGGRRRL